jgi:NitT/TauT family transport system substrate-binding protein
MAKNSQHSRNIKTIAKVVAGNILLLCLLSLSGSSINAQEKESSNKIIFTPQWLPQAQFAGYYVALDQGFYSQAGLDVQITHPSPATNTLDLLSQGSSHIVSAFLMHGLKAIKQGAPIKHIAQMQQHSSLMLVTRKESNIENIPDLDGKKLGIWDNGFDDLIFALFKSEGICVKVVRISNTVNLFLEKGIDAMTVMYYNEYNQIINSGIDHHELNVFFMKELGLDIPEDALFCLQETWEKEPAKMESFVKASLKGWEYAAQNKEYALELVEQYMKQANLPTNRVQQRWMLDKIIENMEPYGKTVKKGELDQKDYNRTTAILN